jgi:hypothetical protein
MTDSVLSTKPDRIQRVDVTVMQQTTVDDLAHIQAAWPSFERLVGMRGRKMYAYVYERANTYTVCTPIRDDDPVDHYGLQRGTLPGGWYLRGCIVGEPPEVYERIMPGMQELKTSTVVDDARPLVEYYRRHDQIELWVPLSD